jgi:Flp pilus assembly protein TadD
MRKHLLTLWFVIAFIRSLPGQPVNGAPANSGHQTYAVAIGISRYPLLRKDEQLQYANKDAEAFAGYLLSTGVPAANIKLLTDSMASTAEIYNALYALKRKCRENDMVFIYFSGHGNIENSRIDKSGYLLTYNTPRNTYRSFALDMDDLNLFAKELSVENKARVVLITDACHSGVLTSDLKGKQLFGENLRRSKQNEIRITSCTENQLSIEGEEWGGGRGIFSYYLISGLTGLADNETDGYITLNELRNFMDTAFSGDTILKIKNHDQRPVIPADRNNSTFRLAAVDTSRLLLAKKQFVNEQTEQRSRIRTAAEEILQLAPADYFFTHLGQLIAQGFHPEEKINFKRLDSLAEAEIPFSFIQQLKAVADTLYQLKFDQARLDELTTLLRADTTEIRSFKDRMIVLFHNRVQEIINLYLEGNAAELERRAYYNSDQKNYDVYPDMLSVGQTLCDPDNPLYGIMQTNKHYMKGLVLRLKIPQEENPQPLIAAALEEQKKAYARDKKAANILHELGILSELRNELKAAEKYYEEAAEIAQGWSLPLSNLAGLYIERGDFEKAREKIERVKVMEQDSLGVIINTALLHEATGNLLLAEEYFHKGIRMNSRSYYPFHKLAHMYLHTARYALADSFFYESEVRRKNYYLLRNPRLMKLPKPVPTEEDSVKVCYDNRIVQDTNSVLENFAQGMFYFNYRQHSGLAEERFKKVIQLDKKNPLAYHYLGILLYEQKRWQEAEYMLKAAIDNYLAPPGIEAYAARVGAGTDTVYGNCILSTFNQFAYDSIENNYLLAVLYDDWSHYTEAEEQCRLILANSRNNYAAYFMLWHLLEKTGRYKETEDVIKEFRLINRKNGNRELNAFYNRMKERYPGQGEWYYKSGLLYYHMTGPGNFAADGDTRYIEPDTRVVKNNFYPDSWYRLFNNLDSGSIRLPGTGKKFRYADRIFLPRENGINNLLKAEDWAPDDGTKADIHDKLGDLYVWQGIAEFAVPHYKEAIELIPENASIKMKLSGVYSSLWYLSEDKALLDTLFNNGKISSAKLISLAAYYIYEGNPAKAGRLLDSAMKVNPVAVPELLELNGRMQMLTDHPEKAISFYKYFYQLRPGNADAAYAIASLYIQLKNRTEALSWLEKSVNDGLNYSYLLKNDPVWDSMIRNRDWQKLADRVSEKIYNARLDEGDKPN